MSKHTQWIGADENGNFNPDHEWSVSNEDCAMSSSLPIWEGDEVIAFVVYRSDDWYKNEPKIVTDRARLIAAAPDLLEALTIFVQHFGDPFQCARAALSAATGDQHE